MDGTAIIHALCLFVVGIFAGFINTVAGGGSLLTLPLLIFIGLPATVANGTNRVAILLQNLVAFWGFVKAKAIPFKTIWPILIAAGVGGYFGTSTALNIDEETFKRLLSLVVLICVILTFFKTGRKKENTLGSKRSIWIFIPFFLAIGWYGGFIQAGVGFIIIAVLSLVWSADLKTANAIKIATVLTYTIVAIFLFGFNEKVDWSAGLQLAAGNMTGAFLGVKVATKENQKWVRIVLLATGIAFSIALLLQ